MSEKTKAKKENKGQFKKGNEIGIDTRFKIGNTISTKYDESYPDSILKYFIECETLPIADEWAVINGISASTVDKWIASNAHPRFTSAYEQCMKIQKIKLQKNGIRGIYNAELTKFLLKNNHGMTDKTEQKIEGEAKADITVKIHEVG